MITITKNGNAVLFEFEENSHYLFNGTIEVPLNSLTLVTDESEMFTFKKAATNDIFISARYDDVNMSKFQLIDFYIANMVGGGGGGSQSGVTSGEVQTMIDTSLEDYYDKDEVDAAISGKADSSAVTQEISAAVSGKADSSSVYTKSEVDAALNDKADSSAVTETITAAVSGKADSSAVTQEISAAVSGKVDTNAFNTYSAATNARLAEDEEVTAAAFNDLNEALSGKADTSAVTQEISAAVSGKVDTNAFNTYSAATNARLAEDEEVTAAAFNDLNEALSGKADTSDVTEALSGKQDTLIAGSGITISGNVISSEGGGNNVIELTQAEYDALVDKDPSAFYIITDAEEINISDYYTSAQTQSAISEAISGKADSSAVTQEISAAVSGKVDTSAFTSYSGSVEAALNGKQDTLSAGTSITISSNTVSCVVDNALDSTSENPVQNKVIYAVIGDIESLLSNI